MHRIRPFALGTLCLGAFLLTAARVNADGSLDVLGAVGGLPTGSVGLAAS